MISLLLLVSIHFEIKLSTYCYINLGSSLLRNTRTNFITTAYGLVWICIWRNFMTPKMKLQVTYDTIFGVESPIYTGL